MKTCEKCNAIFECKAEDPTQKCWCMDLPIVYVPDKFSNCLCKKCLSLYAEPASKPILIENIDYKLNESGLIIFTKDYHLKRGYCCKSGCKNCPY